MTFDFLGFTHIAGRSRDGRFQLKRTTRRDRMRATLQRTLQRVKGELRRRMHEPIPVQGKWLGQVVRGYFAYHSVPTNTARLSAFRDQVKRIYRDPAVAVRVCIRCTRLSSNGANK